LREKIRFYAGFAAGLVWLAVCSVIGFARLAFGPHDRSATTFYARLFCTRLARAVGWSIDVDRPERLLDHRPCVFISNHQSILDVIVFGAIVPGRTVALGKKEVGRIPLFGWFFRAAGNLIVDRGNSAQTGATLDQAAEIIHRERLSVWIMAEGHRNDGVSLLPFKTGAFRLAAAAGVPIVPVVAEPLGAVVNTATRRTRPGPLRIRVLDPIPPPGTGAESITAAVSEARGRMQGALDSLRADAPPPV
jgi:1-acyl-sn-glycerol-3-phosphate acyltransferase